jgi:hypothetical protein
VREPGTPGRAPALAEILVRKGYISEAQLEPLLERQRGALAEGETPVRLGELLLAAGLVSRAQLNEALAEQAQWRLAADRARRWGRREAEFSRAGRRDRLDVEFAEYWAQVRDTAHADEFRDAFIQHGGGMDDWRRLTTSDEPAPAAETPPELAEPPELREPPQAPLDLALDEQPWEDHTGITLRPRSLAAPRAFEQIRKAVLTWHGRGRTRVVLDFSGLDDVSLAVTGSLIDLVLRCGEQGCVLAVVRPSRPCRQPIAESQLRNATWCYDNLGDASDALRRTHS